jgi:hypothetical protein
VVGRLAGGALAAHVGVRLEAGVAALEGDAGLVAGTVAVLGALSIAPAGGKTVRKTASLVPCVNLCY